MPNTTSIIRTKTSKCYGSVCMCMNSNFGPNQNRIFHMLLAVLNLFYTCFINLAVEISYSWHDTMPMPHSCLLAVLVGPFLFCFPSSLARLYFSCCFSLPLSSIPLLNFPHFLVLFLSHRAIINNI